MLFSSYRLVYIYPVSSTRWFLLTLRNQFVRVFVTRRFDLEYELVGNGTRTGKRAEIRWDARSRGPRRRLRILIVFTRCTWAGDRGASISPGLAWCASVRGDDVQTVNLVSHADACTRRFHSSFMLRQTAKKVRRKATRARYHDRWRFSQQW